MIIGYIYLMLIWNYQVNNFIMIIGYISFKLWIIPFKFYSSFNIRKSGDFIFI